jgi:hypothetical protein
VTRGVDIALMYVIEREAVNLTGGQMSPSTIFNLHLILGYVAWLLCFCAYLLPRLKSLDQVEALRAMPSCTASASSGLFLSLSFKV